MDNKILFTERQKFNQWWIWLILLAINGFFILGVFKQLVIGQQFGDKPMNNTELLIIAGLTFMLSILFLNFRLETQIKKDGIYVRFFPFHIAFKHYTWDIIAKSYVRQYSAITEYGGWGLRLGLFGKGKAYNVSGDKGLQLEFTNNKKLLIGTNMAETLTETLSSIGQLKL
jgi:hypothetical protein